MSIKGKTAEQNASARGSLTRSQSHAARNYQNLPDSSGIAALQQSAGNLVVQQFFGSRVIQAKLSVSQPNDPDEQEADQVADRIMQTARPGVAAPCSACSGAEPCHTCAEPQLNQIWRKANGAGMSQQ